MSEQGAEGQAEVGEPLLSPTQSMESPPPDYPTPFVARLTLNYPPEFSTLTIEENSVSFLQFLKYTRGTHRKANLILVDKLNIYVRKENCNFPINS